MSEALLQSTMRSELLNSFDPTVDLMSLNERADQAISHQGPAMNYEYDIQPTSSLVHGSALHFMIPSYDALKGMTLRYTITSTTGLSDKNYQGGVMVNDESKGSTPGVFRMTDNFGANYWSSITLSTASGRLLLTLYPDMCAYSWKNHEERTAARLSDVAMLGQSYTDMNGTSEDGTVVKFGPATPGIDDVRSLAFINGVNRSVALNYNDATMFECLSPLPFEIFSRVQTWYDSNHFEQLKLTVNTRAGDAYAYHYEDPNLKKKKVLAVMPGAAVVLRCHYVRRPTDIAQAIRSRSFKDDITNMLTYDTFQEVGKSLVTATDGPFTIDLRCKNLVHKTFVFVHKEDDITGGDPGHLSPVKKIRFLDGAQELASFTKKMLKYSRRDLVHNSQNMYVIDFSTEELLKKASFDCSGISLAQVGNPRLEVTLQDGTSAKKYDILVYHEIIKTLSFDRNSRKVESPAVM